MIRNIEYIDKTFQKAEVYWLELWFLVGFFLEYKMIKNWEDEIS